MKSKNNRRPEYVYPVTSEAPSENTTSHCYRFPLTSRNPLALGLCSYIRIVTGSLEN